MKAQALDRKIKVLASHVGDFIRYWGFRRIHGEIWAVLYLSKTPLSGVELIERLQVSKALVSPALKELEAEGLIEQVPSENSKVKRYLAKENVGEIIKGVLRRREKPMLEKVWQSYASLPKSALSNENLRPDRFEQMGAMIQMAQLGLNYMLEMDESEIYED